MTRTTLNRTLRRSYWILGIVLVISLVAKLAEHIPGLAGSPVETLAKDIYEYLKDMALVFVTVVAAYLANVFQRRAQFITALKEEWRDIIRSKSALYAYTQLDAPSTDDYLKAFCSISETIDNMRTVYENVGETETQIGLYPYAPLHDMRRALQWLEPRKRADITPEDRKLARDAILQAFYAVREGFLGELDLEAPDDPVLIYGARRLKKSGAAASAAQSQERQRQQHDTAMPVDPRIHAFLTELYDKEHATAKPWRHVANGAEPASTTRPATPSPMT
ncbi:MAG: hypothetical protein ACKVP7_02765 [Hyphomicrobiaceae bacterium]